MKGRRQWLIALLTVMLAGIAAAYLINHLERYEETVDQGPSPAVKANSYLAAERFLRQRSIPVRQAETTHDLPEAGQRSQTLLLLDSRVNMTPPEVERVLRWARSGGHLLFVAEQLWDEKRGRSGDLLLDRLEIHQLLSEDLEPAPDATLLQPVIPLRAPLAAKQKPSWPQLTRLYVENEVAAAYMSFDTRFHLEDPQDHAQSWANSAQATHMLQMVYGDGLITVVTDADLWKTNAIGRYDNAWLLWYLTQDSDVTMVVSTRHDTLFSLLLRHFPLLLVTLVLLLGAGLWCAGMRSGPMRSPNPIARRQLVEHLRAGAAFQHRYNGEQTLLRTLQQDILRRARHRQPGFELMPVVDQWQALSRLTQQPVSFISQALRPRPAGRVPSSEFTQQVNHLQVIRNSL